MAKYKNGKEVIELMKDGWRLSEKTNYRKKVMSYWLSKKDDRTELYLTRKTRDELYKKGLIDSNDMLVKSA